MHSFEVNHSTKLKIIKQELISNSNFIQIYQYTNKTFIKSAQRDFTSWGGSDTCQVPKDFWFYKNF